MRLINVLLVLMLFFPEDGISQKKKMNEHPFNGTFVLSLEGAVTTGMTDYKDYAFDYSGHGRLEYFFPLNSSFCLGLSMVGGAGYLSQEDANLSPNVRTDFLYGGGGITLGYLIGRTVLLYVTGVPAYMWFNPKDNNGNLMPNNQSNLYDNFTLDITGGGGLRFLLSDNITFNITGGFHYADTDYLDDVANGSVKDIILTGGAGVSISMGGVTDSDNDGVDDEIDQCPETPENVRVDDFGCPLDEDRDGVPDYLDKCLDTPENAPVDSLGCSKDSDGDGVPDLRDKCPDTEPDMIVNADGCSEDADRDGVPDGIDKCPGTIGIPVDKFGCPLDSDQDGVPDYKDDCPNTSVLEEVDENGCPEEKEYILTISANFAPNSTEIKQGSMDEMEKIIKYMRQDKKSNWLIQGHTDNTGTRAVNMRISRERAESVKDYLVERGIDASRFTIEGVGPDQPVASNLTPEGRAENRRVVISKIRN